MTAVTGVTGSIQLTTRGIRYSFGCFSRIKMVGRIETRTRDRIYCQTIRTVRDISRDDRAIIESSSLMAIPHEYRIYKHVGLGGIICASVVAHITCLSFRNYWRISTAILGYVNSMLPRVNAYHPIGDSFVNLT